MIGGLLSLLSGFTFAYANASVRRGVLTGTVLQAVAISLPVALPIFVIAMLVTGGFQLLAGFSWRSIELLALAGVIHFAWARHCNYRATKAIGANLVAPLQQFNLVIRLVLAVFWLGEKLTVLRIVGIVLVFLGPALTLNSGAPATDTSVNNFNPQYADGYFYALLSSLGFGLSPILIGMAFDNKSVAVGIAGVFVSYAAAMLSIAVVLLLPGQWQSFKSLDSTSGKWFVLSGIAVGFSQMFRYMALATVNCICAASCERTLAITMKSERIGHWTKMRRSLAQFSGPKPSGHTRFSAGFTTNTLGSRFSVHTGSFRPLTNPPREWPRYCYGGRVIWR